MDLKHLFQPIAVGGLTLRNRIVQAPMESGLAETDGSVSDRQIDYYRARARNGPGLVIVEATCIHRPTGRMPYRELFADEDRYVKGLARLAAVIHEEGAPAVLQLFHGGAWATPTDGSPPLSASAFDIKANGVRTRAMTPAEIAEQVEQFASAARRARAGGFDGVELHAAHGYLISQFLSAATNHRDDAYGGSLANRLRFLLEIVAAIHAAAGRDFPVFCRLSSDEYVPGGITQAETIAMLPRLVDVGVVAIDVSAGSNFSNDPIALAPAAYPRGCLLPLARAIRAAATVPIIAVGRINRPEDAEAALANGDADLVALGRPLLADPEWVAKAQRGESARIAPCIACNIGCLQRAVYATPSAPVQCVVNAAVGREREYAIRPAPRRRRVLVAGGGPAGLEAARVAALRGHDVILCERDGRLGGQLIVSAMPPHKQEIWGLLEYLEGEVRRQPVDVRLETAVTPELVRELAPDAIIVATGCVPAPLDLPGVDQDHVVTFEDVLLKRQPVGQRVVVVGGGSVACETAEYLLARGRDVAVDVTVTKRGGRFAPDLEPMTRALLLRRLREAGARLLVKVKYRRITAEGFEIETGAGVELIRADTVVLAIGSIPNNQIVEAVRPLVATLFAVGDCVHPRTFLEAIQEGAAAARAV